MHHRAAGKINGFDFCERVPDTVHNPVHTPDHVRQREIDDEHPDADKEHDRGIFHALSDMSLRIERGIRARVKYGGIGLEREPGADDGEPGHDRDEEDRADGETTLGATVSANGDVQSEDGEAPKPRKKTRRGSRGGRNRRKKPVAASTNGGEETSAGIEEPEPVSDEYVPMSEWIDEVDR